MVVFQAQVNAVSVFSIIIRTLFILAVGLGLAACGGGGGSPGDTNTGTNPSVAAKTSVIPPGAICANGGVLVETGIDENSNGVLDASEVDASESVCNGEPGPSSLIDMNPEPVGVNCPNGGLRIDVGIDTNGNGSLDPAEITQTGFVCSGTDGSIGWQVAERIETAPSSFALAPKISMDSLGNAIAVWSETSSDGTRRADLWSNRYVADVGWDSLARLVEFDDTESIYSSHLEVSASGDGMAVWLQNNGSIIKMLASRYVLGMGWAAAELINAGDARTTGAARISQFQMSMDADGNAIVVWQQFDGFRESIWANRYEVATGWGNSEIIDTTNDFDSISPRVSVGDDGSAVVVWIASDGANDNVWARRYVPGTGWASPEQIKTDAASDGSYAQVSVDSIGNAMAVWRQRSSTDTYIASNRYVVGEGWGVAEQVVSATAGLALEPLVAVDASGNAVTVWLQNEGAGDNLWSNRYVVGSGWGIPEAIETYQYSPSFAQVSMAANGNAVVIWEVLGDIWSNRYVVGRGWGAAEIIDDSGVNTAVFPQVAIGNDGNAIAVWAQLSGEWNVDGDSIIHIWSNRWRGQ